MEPAESCQLELGGSDRWLLDVVTAIVDALGWDEYFGQDIHLSNVGLYSGLHLTILPIAPAAAA
jgi:hypothetical protein